MTKISPEPVKPDPQVEMSVFDPENPFSIVNITPERTSAAITLISKELRVMSEEKLRAQIDPDASLCRLRISFWDEYERCRPKGVRMNIANVCKGVCTRDYWDEIILLDPRYMAWITCPPKDYTLAMKELLDISIDRLREIVKLPFADPKTGRINPALVAQVLTAIQMLDQRVKGAIVQKVAIKQQTAHAHAHVHQTGTLPGTGGKQRSEIMIAPAEAFDADDEMAALAELEAKIASVSGRLIQARDEASLLKSNDHTDMIPSPTAAPTEGRPRPKRPDAEVLEADYDDLDDPESFSGA